ncbi:MAG: hypothetical protein O2816_16760 [Planctomycetota bacterium]|nr:hypothetical protein [Planctomycetota bacterium]
MTLLTIGLCLALAQDGVDLDREGALRNDTFLPSSEAPQAALRAGDEAWQAVREGTNVSLSRSHAFDHWRRALVESEPGDVVRLVDAAAPQGLFPDRDHTHERRVEGVVAAVQRRLQAGGPEHRAAWRDRFGDLAWAQLARDPFVAERLQAVEREWPSTRAAATAALRLTDRELEAGRLPFARTWLARAWSHVEEDDPLTAALTRRESMAAALTGAETIPAWRSAHHLRLVQNVRLETDQRVGRDPRPAPLGRTLSPGATGLAGGGLAVQTPRGLVWVDASIVRGEKASIVERLGLAEFLDIPRLQPYVYPSAGGWPLRPASDGSLVYLVLDRGHPGRAVREFQLPARGNHLVCVRPDGAKGTKLVWHLSGFGLRTASDPPVPALEATGLPGQLEFQPGPVLSEGTLYAQVRVLADPTAEGEARGGSLHLCAFDAATGRARWTRYLTRAADLRRDLGGRNGSGSDIPTSGMPLALIDGALIVGTNVGLVCAFDAVDGRWLWGVRTRRRRAEDEGWPGSRVPLAADLTAGRAVLVAPFDSDRWYALPSGPATGDDFFVREPGPLGTTLDLIGAHGDEALSLGRDGRHLALRRQREGEAGRSALYLGRGERFQGTALVSPERVIFSSDRALYLFDRTQGDLLLATIELPDLGAGVGGDVVADGDRVFVIGSDSLWVLAVE